MSRTACFRLNAFLVAAVILSATGCTSFHDYVHNGFKVGPNYHPAPAPVAQHWINQADFQQTQNPEILACWWRVFNDQKLNDLVWCAFKQNLTLKDAGLRVLQERALRGVAVGNLFPQTQQALGSYTRQVAAAGPASGSSPTNATFSDSWATGFSLNWELDFWGHFRRAILQADANLEASCYGYDAALVTMLGDVAQAYVRLRTDQERIKLLEANAEVQRGVLKFIETRFRAGFRQTELDYDQAVSNLRQTESQILPLAIDARQAEDQLCILMGMPPADLEPMLGIAPIPNAPPEVVIGIPADLLRRRPDVRQKERLAAAQAEQIGIDLATLYPTFSINGAIGYQAQNFPDLFRNSALNGSVGPQFKWNVLNYGRILNTTRADDALFQALVVEFQQSVLQADREVEDGLVSFLQSQRETKLLEESVVAAERAVKIVVLQYEKGAVDFNRYAVIEQNLVTQQDGLAQARGQIAQGLVAMYRAMGGGWEIRLGAGDEAQGPAAAPNPPTTPQGEQLPVPQPTDGNAAGVQPALPPVPAAPLPPPESSAKPVPAPTPDAKP
jgi:NodT family efflux transporter outer membrane factor (OMF) lipoprotein